MIKIQNVNDAAYKRFGKVITDIELGDHVTGNGSNSMSG